MNDPRWTRRWLSVFITGGLVSLLLSSFSGTTWISPLALSGTGDDWWIWSSYRIPRIIFAFCIGGTLTVVGAIYQCILTNPLADPHALGTSSAAAFGIVLAGLGGAPFDGLVAKSTGIFGALVLSFLLITLNRRMGTRLTERMLLFGLTANLFLSSMLFIILSVQSNILGAGSMRWLFGRIPWLNWGEVWTTVGFVVAFVSPALVFSEALGAISLGDSVCRSLGFNPAMTRNVALLLSAIVVAWMVSFTGAIGFVGLVIPHLVRRAFSLDQGRTAFVIQFFFGGTFMVVSDAISRTIHPPLEIPIGLITSLWGGPIFLALLWNQAGRRD